MPFNFVSRVVLLDQVDVLSVAESGQVWRMCSAVIGAVSHWHLCEAPILNLS